MWTDALAEWVRTSCDAVRVEVRAPGVEPSTVPEGPTSFEGDPCRAHPVLRLAVETPDGTRRLTLRPTLDVWVEAPVAAAAAAPGEPVTWTLSMVKLGAASGVIVSPGDWVASGPVAAGAVLTTLSVVPRPDAAAGATVALSVRSGALEIRSEARLLRDSRVGDEVRVFVPATNKVVLGRLVDPTTVEL